MTSWNTKHRRKIRAAGELRSAVLECARANPRWGAKLIAKEIGSTQDSVSSVMARLRRKGELPRRDKKLDPPPWPLEMLEEIRLLRVAGWPLDAIATKVGKEATSISRLCSKRGWRPAMRERSNRPRAADSTARWLAARGNDIHVNIRVRSGGPVDEHW